MTYQHTIIRPVSMSGTGLHSGKMINMTLRPADAGNGIIFHRRDVQHQVSIEAISANVVDTRLATVLGKNGLTISTVEHLLAALHAFGIDNLHIDIDGPEVPVLDGSARTFAEQLGAVGVCRLQRRRKFLAVKQAMSIADGDKWIHVLPSRSFRISCNIDFSHPCISSQSRSIKINSDSFQKEIASARTFGFLKEVEYLKANGLARGGSLDNAVVIAEDRILNPEGLRYSDEFVRHKILDAIGDFSLLGYPILGHIKAYKPGHDINHQMVEKILASPECWKLIDLDGQTTTPLPLSIFATEPLGALSKA